MGIHVYRVTYLRLDGSVESEKRFDIVKAFNSDPTIDVLLLTTHGTFFVHTEKSIFDWGLLTLLSVPNEEFTD